MLNFDNIQIITALNDSEFMKYLVTKINNQLLQHMQLPKNQQAEKSLCTSYIMEREKEIEKNKENVQNIYNELKQFNTPAKKKSML